MSTPPTFPDPLGKRATPRRTCGAGRRRPGALLPPLLPCPQPRPRLPALRKFLGLDPTCPRRCTRPSCTTVQGKGRWQGELRLKGQALIPRAPHMGISLRRWLVGQDKSGIGKKKKKVRFVKDADSKPMDQHGVWGLGMVGSQVPGECVSILPHYPPSW